MTLAYLIFRARRRNRVTASAYPQTFVLADMEANGIEPRAAHVAVRETLSFAY